MFPSDRQVAYVLLTSPPLTAPKVNLGLSPFDLHVLCAPPAFILSQDQTLLFLLLSFVFQLFSLAFYRELFQALKISCFYKIFLNLLFRYLLINSSSFACFFNFRYRLGYFSKGFYCLLFNVLFPVRHRTILIIQHYFFFVNTFFIFLFL